MCGYLYAIGPSCDLSVLIQCVSTHNLLFGGGSCRSCGLIIFEPEATVGWIDSSLPEGTGVFSPDGPSDDDSLRNCSKTEHLIADEVEEVLDRK